MFEFFLDSSSLSSPAPLLFASPSSVLVLGRDDALLAIHDKAVSRRQLELRRDPTRPDSLLARVLGTNASVLGSHVLSAADDAVSLRDGDRVSLLHDAHSFTLRVVRVASTDSAAPLCPHGALCDRQNPLHQRQFRHESPAEQQLTVPLDDNNNNNHDDDNIDNDNDNDDDELIDSGDEKKQKARQQSAAAFGWRGALQDYARKPESCGSTVRLFNDRVVVIEDKFPKARVHLLVLARDLSLNKATDLRREHLPLLREMERVADEQIARARQRGSATEFQVGFHAVPSMLVLHVHVISRDFKSTALKHKKHWNSFTTPFFVTLRDVIERVETTGRVTLRADESESQLSANMTCPHCGAALRNMPAVKSHRCGGITGTTTSER
jgi:diadenosine tetraphosphate (Ap4A) HIT family hydrolase